MKQLFDRFAATEARDLKRELASLKAPPAGELDYSQTRTLHVLRLVEACEAEGKFPELTAGVRRNMLVSKVEWEYLSKYNQETKQEEEPF